MDVRFREADPFNCWLWLRFATSIQRGEGDFVLGKLGGFNAASQQF